MRRLVVDRTNLDVLGDPLCQPAPELLRVCAAAEGPDLKIHG